jgi:1-acyl-sn-glycerol-3-phosphate acyltransferase
MNKKGTRIHRFNIFYLILKTYQLLVFHLFYKRVEVIGRKNIPYGSPIIFTPNHQNALMDALIVLDTCRLNPVFMARADIFKKKSQKKILTFLKMLPVYRIRDGAEELPKNNETFDICLEILRDCYSVCLMPEGNHGDKRRLRQLVKGTFRIAFKAHEEFGHINSVKIVPVGVDYEHYQKIEKDLLVIYGKPIEVADYFEAYKENPAKAMNAIKDRLSDELKKLMIHIENEEHYEMYQGLRLIYNRRMRKRMGILGNSPYRRFLADKQMIALLNDFFISDNERLVALSGTVKNYVTGLAEIDLRDWVIDRKGFTVLRIILQGLLTIILFPVFVTGAVTNLIPYYLPRYFSRNVKDPQFLSSFVFALALVIFLIYYIIAAILIAALTGPWWITWATLAGMLGTGYFALYYYFSLKKLIAAVRYIGLKIRGDARIKKLIVSHYRIVTTMNSLIDTYNANLLKQEEKGWNEKS